MNPLLIVLMLSWPSIVERVTKAVPAGNVAELRALQSALSTDTATEESLRRYTHAYVLRALAFASKTTSEERRELLAGTIAELERAVQANPNNAEARALLGSTYGAYIASVPWRAIDLSVKSRNELRKAMELQPHNPRIHFLHGSSAFYKPVEYGGGPAVAEPLLRKALDLFRNEPPQKPWPNWGRFDTYVLLGQTLEKLGKRDAALEQYEQALAIAPDSAYVRSVLMPRVRKK